MAKFIVRDTMACMVTWSYTIEAESVEEAEQKFQNGEHDAPLQLPEIGDSLDYVPQTTEIEAA